MATNGGAAGILGLLVAAAASGGGDDTFVFDSGRSRHVIGNDLPDELADEPTVVVSRAVIEKALAEPEPRARTWTRDEIDNILRQNDAAVERGIINLFHLQTAYEQRAAGTVEHNNVGFNATNARAGTRFARWLLGMDDNNVVRYPPKHLTHAGAGKIFKKYVGEHGSVMNRARAICLLHSGQLTDLANGKLTLPG